MKNSLNKNGDRCRSPQTTLLLFNSKSSDRQNQPFLFMAIALTVTSIVIKPNTTAFLIHPKIAVIIISFQRKKLININFNPKDISNTIGNFPCGILPRVVPAHFPYLPTSAIPQSFV